jgi:serine/threonine-protein kinase HipA
MISEAYIWIWLPGDHEPVVCGKLEADNNIYSFVYGRSYLERSNAMALDPLVLPLQDRVFSPSFGETHSVIRDAAPDAWGRRVLIYKSGGQVLSELDYLLQAGRDRFGALDVREEATGYITIQSEQASIADLVTVSEKIETGQPIQESLANAILHGSSVGGARPKSLLNDENNKWIAKFSSTTDHYPVVRSEYAAMWLAGQCGIEVPTIKLMKELGKDVLLVRRFDRELVGGHWHRRFLISGLTALQLHETEAVLASYPELASFIRRSGGQYPADAQQLFRRMVFNILIGNTDDHARNHSFFWDGHQYVLTPAYDICPLLRVGQSANQAMVVGSIGRESTLRNGLSQSEQFGLTFSEAKKIQEEILETIQDKWDEAADHGAVTKNESRILKQSTILSPACFY